MQKGMWIALMWTAWAGMISGCLSADDVDTAGPSNSQRETDTPQSSSELALDDMDSETDSDDTDSTDSMEALRCEDMTPCERVDHGNGWACPETAESGIDCVRVRFCDRTLCISYPDACRLSGCSPEDCGVLDTDPGEVVCM